MDFESGAGRANFLASANVVDDMLNAMAIDTNSAVTFFDGTSRTNLSR